MAYNYTSLYNRLANKVNKLRKRLIRKKRQFEKEDEEMRIRGRFPRPRPDYTIPMKQRLLEPTKEQLTKEAYQSYKNKIEALYGKRGVGEKGFYRENYKKNYLDTLAGGGFIDKTPDGIYYSKEQIENADREQQDLMRLYNMIQHMSIDEFMALYDNGYITKLSFIYQGLTDAKGVSFYDEQKAFREQAIREHRSYYTRREYFKGLPKNKPVKPVNRRLHYKKYARKK